MVVIKSKKCRNFRRNLIGLDIRKDNFSNLESNTIDVTNHALKKKGKEQQE